MLPVLAMAFLVSLFYSRINTLLDETSKVIPKMEYILNTIDSNDMVIIGASRAFYHYNPRIIDSVCNIKSYNLGMDGSNIVEQNMVLHTYLQHHPVPKVVLLNVDGFEFDSKEVVYNDLDYMPYLKVPEVKKTIGSYEHFKYSLLAPLFLLERDCSLPDDKVKVHALFSSDDTLLSVFKEEGEEKYYGEAYNGYQANNAPLEADVNDPVKIFPVNYDTEGLNILVNMIQFCKSKHITPVFVYGPLYHTYTKKFPGCETLMNKIAVIAEQNNVLYLDYSKAGYSSDSSCFYNIQHLNGKGSALFSKQVAMDLKRSINWHE